MVSIFCLRHCGKVEVSLALNEAVSEIYTVGKHLKKASFDVEKSFLGKKTLK